MTKTALITGATSGIGEAAARAFVAAGWRVIATGRRAERLEKLAASLRAERLHPAVFDVTDEAARDSALAAIPHAFRDIDLLINNAGLALGRNPAQGADLAQWKTMIETNVTALASPADLAPQIASLARSGDFVVCLGAGSITQWAQALPAELERLHPKRRGARA